MGKVLDALQRAEREHQKKILGAPLTDESFGITHSESSYAGLVPKRISFLKTKLLRTYRADSIKTIMFTGTSHKCGTTTTAISLGTMLAKEAGYKVLLVDTNIRNPGLHSVFDMEPTAGICELIGGNGSNAFEFKRVGPARLYFVPCGIVSADSNRKFDSPRFESFLKLAREKFDFVILDAAPIGKYPEPQTICSKVDGVVMVITSGKTRRQVAKRVKNEVEDAGGTVLGVVINRRKYYIPEWIYKRL
jgi:capsular exopolysaccharide synthesis family protein